METREEKEYFINVWKQCTLANHGCGTYFYAVIVFVVVMILSSCATKTKIEYRDRDVNHYITNVVHDTLIDKTKDSVFYEVKVKGDTVFATKYKEIIRWRDRIVERHDTCFRDSVVTKTEVTTKGIIKIPKIFYISLVISIICIIFAIVKLLRWLKKL